MKRILTLLTSILLLSCNAYYNEPICNQQNAVKISGLEGSYQTKYVLPPGAPDDLVELYELLNQDPKKYFYHFKRNKLGKLYMYTSDKKDQAPTAKNIFYINACKVGEDIILENSVPLNQQEEALKGYPYMAFYLGPLKEKGENVLSILGVDEEELDKAKIQYQVIGQSDFFSIFGIDNRGIVPEKLLNSMGHSLVYGFIPKLKFKIK